ncbi:hypothetical protein ATO67_14875 [Agrobacterium bohemicum]|uniref:Uncharacterized protein n=1 Tax=Agrobacterium bohemicum TaxID=2052828 RepID=A0A135NXC1_9HYPH|nr:hypothetical protein ATO67_14875 [Agrobacterium bohemicum]
MCQRRLGFPQLAATFCFAQMRLAKSAAKRRQALVISVTFMYRLRIELGSHGQMVWSFNIELAQLTQLRQMVRTSPKQEDCHEG